MLLCAALSYGLSDCTDLRIQRRFTFSVMLYELALIASLFFHVSTGTTPFNWLGGSISMGVSLFYLVYSINMLQAFGPVSSSGNAPVDVAQNAPNSVPVEALSQSYEVHQKMDTRTSSVRSDATENRLAG